MLVPRKTNLLTMSLLAIILSVATAGAQQRATLAQIDSLMQAGSTEQARASLAKWRTENPSPNTDSAMRAEYFNARLTSDARAAEDSYLRIAITAPASNAHVPEALLRVGQAELAAGAPRNAITYLKRLIENYGSSEHAGLGAVWLARAYSADKRATDACTVVSAALRNPRVSEEARGLLRSEQAACTGNVANTERPVTTPAPAPPSTQVTASTASNFAIQVAAFRDKSNALGVVRQLHTAGYQDVRLVTVPENTLFRVRIGHFQSSASAAEILGKLKASGFVPAIVSDVLREQPVKD